MATALSLFAPPAYRDVANELDLLDMVDENEQYEIVRAFAKKHIVPYMFSSEMQRERKRAREECGEADTNKKNPNMYSFDYDTDYVFHN